MSALTFFRPPENCFGEVLLAVWAFWKVICPLLPWHLWVLLSLKVAVFGIIMCRCTSYMSLPCLPGLLTFANCKLGLFIYAWDFPLKARAFTFNARSDLPLWHTGWKAQAGTCTRLPWWQERGTHFAKVSVTKKATYTLTECYKFTTWVDLPLHPHLKLLPELQVDIIHLGNGNVVILALFLVQQLVPEKRYRGSHHKPTILTGGRGEYSVHST